VYVTWDLHNLLLSFSTLAHRKGFLEENLLSLLYFLMRVAVADFVQLHAEFLVELLLVGYLVSVPCSVSCNGDST
jgi:hypothetical protein